MVGSNSLNLNGPVHHLDTPYETATFGMGCFWGAECLFGGTYGVLRTKVGYSGGSKPNPYYRNLGDHVECVSLDYDPTKLSYEKVLDLFWNNHEYGLTTRVKRQYMSLILYHSAEQKAAALKSIKSERVNRVPEVIITEIAEAGEFYPAEDYHQKYRLQAHTNFIKKLGLSGENLLTSHVAAKLNGYMVGVGGVKQFQQEVSSFGLDNGQKEYALHYVKKNENAGLSC